MLADELSAALGVPGNAIDRTVSHRDICDSVDQVTAAHNRIMGPRTATGRSNDVVLAQQHLDGDEHYVNTVSRNGAHRVVEV